MVDVKVLYIIAIIIGSVGLMIDYRSKDYSLYTALYGFVVGRGMFGLGM